MKDRLTVAQLIKFLEKQDGENFIQLDFDTTNLNIRNRKYIGRFGEEIDTIFLPTEYEYRRRVV